ncbi:hypothetical protein EDF19_3577 [Curtobacterium sp. PhB115]|nr:hypothetical protein EDF19_3577 [Curtobacterium sp. PhB115]
MLDVTFQFHYGLMNNERNDMKTITKQMIAAAAIALCTATALPTAATATTATHGSQDIVETLTEIQGTQSRAAIATLMDGDAVEALVDSDTGAVLAALPGRSRAFVATLHAGTGAPLG